MDRFSKELVISNLISLNPTGVLNLKDNVLQPTGTNNIIQNSSIASKENLKKAQENEIICNNIEKFENYQTFEQNNKNKILIIILIFIFIFILIFISNKL
jgi:hypothetical protein